MRTLAILSSGVFLVAAYQSALPKPLERHFETLKGASNLTVDYTIRTIGEAPKPYKFVTQRTGNFKLTTPTGYVISDGKTITTYTTATNTYTEEPYEKAVKGFIVRPEVVGWGAFLLENQKDITAAVAGAARTVGGVKTTEVEVMWKGSKTPITFFIDDKLGVVRGWSQKDGEKETLVVAKTIDVVKDKPLDLEQFAFKAPEGAKKEEPAPAGVTFAAVQGLMTANCLPCHGGGNPRAGIGLTNYAGIAAIVTPGKPAESLLIKAVRGAGAKKMPPGNHTPLTDDQIKVLETWIADGAKG